MQFVWRIVWDLFPLRASGPAQAWQGPRREGGGTPGDGCWARLQRWSAGGRAVGGSIHSRRWTRAERERRGTATGGRGVERRVDGGSVGGGWECVRRRWWRVVWCVVRGGQEVWTHSLSGPFPIDHGRSERGLAGLFRKSHRLLSLLQSASELQESCRGPIISPIIVAVTGVGDIQRPTACTRRYPCCGLPEDAALNLHHTTPEIMQGTVQGQKKDSSAARRGAGQITTPSLLHQVSPQERAICRLMSKGRHVTAYRNKFALWTSSLEWKKTPS
jgi:hypothetical protein